MPDLPETSERRRKRFKGWGGTVDDALLQARRKIWEKCNFPPDRPNFYNVVSIRGQEGDGFQPGVEVTIEMEDYFEDE